MQVERPARQHAVMIEAVRTTCRGHRIDEIGTGRGRRGAHHRRRGGQLVATAQATVRTWVNHPSDLVGGLHTVTWATRRRAAAASEDGQRARAPPPSSGGADGGPRRAAGARRRRARRGRPGCGRPVGGERRRRPRRRGVEVEAVRRRPCRPRRRLCRGGGAHGQGRLRVHGWALSASCCSAPRRSWARRWLVARPESAEWCWCARPLRRRARRPVAVRLGCRWRAQEELHSRGAGPARGGLRRGGFDRRRCASR
jgi:hypothetical protein